MIKLFPKTMDMSLLRRGIFNQQLCDVCNERDEGRLKKIYRSFSRIWIRLWQGNIKSQDMFFSRHFWMSW